MHFEFIYVKRDYNDDYGAVIHTRQAHAWKEYFNILMDNLHVRPNLDLAKNNKMYNYSLKEHRETSKIAKFCW